MAEWGRKEYSKKWPSRRPVWGWTAILLTGVFFFGVFCLDYSQGWTAAERLYLMDYLKSGARGQAGAGMQSKYTMLEGVTAKGSPVFLLGDQVERVADVNGKPGDRLTDEGVKAGLVRLEWVTGQYNDRGMHTLLGRWVFKHDDIWGYMERPFYFSLAFLVVALFGSEGQGASDAVQTWPQVARAGAGDDFGVQREAGPVEDDACATAGRGAVHQ